MIYELIGNYLRTPLGKTLIRIDEWVVIVGISSLFLKVLDNLRVFITWDSKIGDASIKRDARSVINLKIYY